MRSITPFTAASPFRFALPALTERGSAFDEFFGGFKNGAGFTPAVDVLEDDEALLIRADLPGVAPDEVELSVTDGVLSLRGERRSPAREAAPEGEGEAPAEPRAKLLERRAGTFSRSFTLPRGIDVESIEASHEHGVLTVRLPKATAMRTKKIAIQSAS